MVVEIRFIRHHQGGKVPGDREYVSIQRALELESIRVAVRVRERVATTRPIRTGHTIRKG